VGFSAFRKHNQRIFKKTDSSHISWLQRIKYEHAECAQYGYREKKRILAVFGHSLGITDRDIISEFIHIQNTAITIFYCNNDSFVSQVANLTAILGVDELIDLSGGDNHSLEFISQYADTFEIKVSLNISNSIGFLELLGVNSVEDLNVAYRWAKNAAISTLKTPIGIDDWGNIDHLDLHERAHGPHGLIAGTTGSGKSEFIITYILSLCVNYAPDEVAFVLIDYKGGGLAGAFENDRYHLPHLSGTITNLDGGAIQRSLVSIQSELKRRQDMFNKARDLTGESTIDIYKYLSYYRQGVLKDPLPHLFIVADEFAELKQQEPEFMEELISAARIGRSLGVHLILATQRPTGVVNDQIWANSKFKVCLKVSDAGDSKEMIHRPDAAEIKNAGRYYLLVGYNESFSGGQAAYAGASYVERQQYEPKTDNAVDLLDDEGNVITTLRPVSASKKSDLSELNAVLIQLMQTADSLNKHAKRLWLDPLPERVAFTDLVTKYGAVDANGLTFVLGEVDDPKRQRQFRRDINLAEVGNIMFYGTHNSGVGELVGSCLYDMATRYDADSYWFYGIDLGAGSIASLESLPQCGGVALAGDSEKVGNLLKMTVAGIEVRKKLIARYKTLDAYNRNAEKTGHERMPRIVLALDNLASFRERYDNLLDQLISIAMDGPMCGVYCMITSVGANTAGMKLKQHFTMDVVCAMNDPSDAQYILTNARNAPTPNNPKRGLINIEKEAYEFQGVSICQDEAAEEQAIANLAARMRGACLRVAQQIPVLPAHVLPSYMGEEAPSHKIPVGFSKKGVEPLFYDATKFPYMLILGEDNEVLGSYLDGMREWFADRGVSYRFLDPDEVLTRAGDDPWVIKTMEGVEAFVKGLPPNPVQADYVIVTTIAKTMNALSEPSKAILNSFIVDERTKGKTVIIGVSEIMRVKGMFDPWFTFLKNPGSGLWVGNGFGNQSILQYGRTLPEYNKPAAKTDGYMVAKNVVTGVRLLEAKANTAQANDQSAK
jgi:S-DNA-T family DNA segregation ATPase FtsK/SpoIIIE